MTTSISAAELASAITAVPGVRGIEPGIGSTLKTVGSRIQGNGADNARFGVIIDADGQSIVLEVGIDGSRPVKDIVREIQKVVLHAVAEARGDRDLDEAVVRVRVQSLLM